MSALTLSALVIRASTTETAAAARDRLWRSAGVLVHVHDFLLTSGIGRCVSCGATIGVVS